MQRTTITVDNRVRVPLAGMDEDVVYRMRQACEHANPEYKKRIAMRMSTYDVPKIIRTWRAEEDGMSLPSGAWSRLVEILRDSGIAFKAVDNRSEGEPVVRALKYQGHKLRFYQHEMVDLAYARERCVVRAATGAGKTLAAFALAAKIGLNTLVILPNAKLLKQWMQLVPFHLGLSGNQIGMIRGSVCRLRPLTLATQQTLWSRGISEDMNDFFGAVIIDEGHHCCDESTPVLMADGTTKAIRDVRVGDETAVGGRVLHTMVNVYDGPLFKVGDAVVTSEHPFATPNGWVSSESLDSGFDLYYDPLYGNRPPALSRLQEEAPPGLRERSVSEVSTALVQRRTMHDVRSPRDGASSGSSHIDQVRDDRSLERGPYGQHVRDVAAHGGGATWCTQASRVENHEAALEGSRCTCPSEQGVVGGAEAAFLTSRGTRSGQLVDEGCDCHGEGQGVRRTEARQREATDIERASTSPDAQGARLRAESRCEDVGETRLRIPVSLQDRSGASPGEDCSGDRRHESRRARSGRREEDLLPHVEGVVGIALPGAVRLQQGRARVQRLPDAAIDVYNLETEKGVYVAGGVLVHNCAARTFMQTIDSFRARYRIAFTADERRKDRKEFIVYDLVGNVAHEVTREHAESANAVVDVEVRIVPTTFECADYPSSACDFNGLLDAMINDAERNTLIEQVAMREIEKGNQVIVLTHRREHARTIEREFVAHGVSSGCMLGEQEAGDDEEFDRSCAGLIDGTVRVACGTYPALGEGIDLPAVSVGVATTPIGKNKQLFNQVRGRLCRPSDATGKTHGVLYYLYDARVFDVQILKNIVAWNRTVKILQQGKWVDGREYLKGQRAGSERRAARGR